MQVAAVVVAVLLWVWKTGECVPTLIGWLIRLLKRQVLTVVRGCLSEVRVQAWTDTDICSAHRGEGFIWASQDFKEGSLEHHEVLREMLPFTSWLMWRELIRLVFYSWDECLLILFFHLQQRNRRFDKALRGRCSDNIHKAQIREWMSSNIGNSHRLQSSRQEFHTTLVPGKQPKLDLNTSVFSPNFDIQASFAAVLLLLCSLFRTVRRLRSC